GGGDVERQARLQPAVARDVARLLAGLGDAATDDLVDLLAGDAGAVHQSLERGGQQLGGVLAGEDAAGLADGRPDGLDDDGFGHVSLPFPHTLSLWTVEHNLFSRSVR